MTFRQASGMLNPFSKPNEFRQNAFAEPETGASTTCRHTSALSSRLTGRDLHDRYPQRLFRIGTSCKPVDHFVDEAIAGGGGYHAGRIDVLGQT
jgi:hypothetical protein